MRKKIPFSPPDIRQEDIKQVTAVLQSGWLTTGTKVKEFEQQLSVFCGTQKTICLNSATACMELCLRLLGVGPGDEVITSAYTYTATASVIAHIGAKIVLIDTEKNSYHLSYEELEKKITSKTKVIMPVDIAGIMCDYDKIFQIVKNKQAIFQAKNTMQEQLNRIVILADSAHSLGATYQKKRSGQVADFTSFSFHAVKNLTTAEGGALTWRSLGAEMDQVIYHKLQLLSLHGQSKDAFSKNQLGAWEYDILTTGYKNNMTDIQAAMGLSQLARYPDLLEKRAALIHSYEEQLNQTTLVSAAHLTKMGQSSGHLYLTDSRYAKKNRNELIYQLAEQGISTNVHYKPLPLFTAYKQLGFCIDDFPHAYDMFENEITLPLYTTLTFEDVHYICEKLTALV